MAETMAFFLANFYGFSLENAREVLSELRDTRSIQKLAGYRSVNTSPHKSLSVGA